MFIGAKSPSHSWTRSSRAPPIVAKGRNIPGARLLDFNYANSPPRRSEEIKMELLSPKCAGLDVHKDSVVACIRIHEGLEAVYSTETFGTTTKELLRLSDWLSNHQVRDVAMEATGVYWKPVWHVLDGSFELVLANAMHIKNVPGRKTDVNDAHWIADLLAHGLIRASFVPPTAIQDMRTMMRT